MIAATAPTGVQRAQQGRARFPHALAPLTLRNVTFANRLFFAPMGVDLANIDGTFSSALAQFLDGMVQGGCGALILSNATVSRDSILQPKALRMFRHEHAEALQPFIAEAERQGVIVGIQLQHYGGQGTTTYSRGKPLLTPSGIAANALKKLDPRYRTKVMTLEDIGDVQQQFVDAARLCRQAGAKLVQLQASNGYLLSSFMSPYTNRRDDRYGGNHLARASMVIETVRAVRAALGDDIVLGIRIGIDDGFETEGTQPEHLEAVIPQLEAAGVDLIEASFFVADTFNKLAGRSTAMTEKLYAQIAQVKRYCRVPLGFAGFVDGVVDADALIAGNVTDLVGMARALFADNDLIIKTVEGREADIHRCLWDGKCFKDKYNPRYQRVYCCVNPKYLRPQ